MSKKKKHTPGPWVWADVKDGSAGVREPENIDYLKRTKTAESLALYGNGEDLAGPVVVSLDCGQCEFFPSEADARLIAAAPDMLAALEQVASMAQTLMDELAKKRATNWGVVHTCLCDCRAAINKAKGGSK